MSEKIDIKQLCKAMIDSTGGDLDKLKKLKDKLEELQTILKGLQKLEPYNVGKV